MEAPVRAPYIYDTTADLVGLLPSGLVFKVERAARPTDYRPLVVQLVHQEQRRGLFRTRLVDTVLDAQRSGNTDDEIKEAMRALLNAFHGREYDERVKEFRNKKIGERIGYYPPKRI